MSDLLVALTFLALFLVVSLWRQPGPGVVEYAATDVSEMAGVTWTRNVLRLEGVSPHALDDILSEPLE